MIIRAVSQEGDKRVGVSGEVRSGGAGKGQEGGYKSFLLYVVTYSLSSPAVFAGAGVFFLLSMRGA